MKKFDTLKRKKAEVLDDMLKEDDTRVFRQMFEDAHYDRDVNPGPGNAEEVLGEDAICNLHKPIDNCHEELVKKAYVKEIPAPPAQHLDTATRKLAAAQQLAHAVETLGQMPKGTRFTLEAPEAMPDADGKCGPNLSVNVYLDDLYDAMRLLLRSRIASASGELDFNARWR